MCWKSQDISCGIREIGKGSDQFGIEIAQGWRLFRTELRRINFSIKPTHEQMPGRVSKSLDLCGLDVLMKITKEYMMPGAGFDHAGN